MPRGVKDSPEVREAKRKARSAFTFSDAAYKHYDPIKEGYGSEAEWIAAADAAASGRGTYQRVEGKKSARKINVDLVALKLEEMPANIEGLKQAFKAAIKIAHPDTGGSTAAARAVLEAYKRLVEFY